MAVFVSFTALASQLFRELRQSGIGANPSKAAAITKEEENMLWNSGVLGTSTPKALQRGVYFSLGKFFCLRGGEEQRQLKPSQLIRKRDPDQYVYVETGSKNRSGGLKEINLQNKVVPVYASPAAGERCVVYLLDLYLSKLPPIAFERDVLYWQPKPVVPDDPTVPWYTCQPVGKHKLSAMVSTMCEEAGIKERKTNHSLRVTGATTLYTGGVPEREIQERTGHRSLVGLRKYERTGEQQHQAISNMLASSVGIPYATHMTSTSRSQTAYTQAGSQCTTSQHPSAVNLPSLFYAASGGTINISPHANFVVNVNMGYPSTTVATEYAEFDTLVKGLDL